jgi:hypothetical protein
MKGFKDDSGKFRPTENRKGVRMSRDQKLKTQGVRLHREDFRCIKCNKPMGEANIGFDKMCHECFVEAKAERTMQEMIPRNVIEKYSRKEREQNLKPKQIGEYELYDILEDVNDFRELDGRVRNNIEFILKREKKWGKNFSVVLPVGALAEYREETSREEFERTGQHESGLYQFDFEIFGKGDTMPYIGTAYGTISGGQMLDMTLELYEAEK